MPASDPARIGPNSIIQTVGALRVSCGEAEADDLLTRSGEGHLVDHLPEEMVNESEFHRLVQVLVAELGPEQTAQVLHESGERTADYLLAHRIPRFFQRLVKVLPRRAGLALLLWAVSFNAWTFVGSGQFRFAVGRELVIRVHVSHPSVLPVAHFYGGTFTRLVHILIDPQATVRTAADQTAHGIDCTYTLLLHRGSSSVNEAASSRLS